MLGLPTQRAASIGTSVALIWSLASCSTDEEQIPERVEAHSPSLEAPDPYQDSPSRFGVVPLHAGFSPDPRVVGGTALGEVKARSVHRKCRGWIARTPDYLLDADTAFFKLFVLGRSRHDVHIVIRKPDGQVLCNDDRKGTKDPMILGDFPIGSTQIWVGVKEQGARAEYRLGFSEVKWKPSSIPLPPAN